jgi:hypothetical protein
VSHELFLFSERSGVYRGPEELPGPAIPLYRKRTEIANGAKRRKKRGALFKPSFLWYNTSRPGEETRRTAEERRVWKEKAGSSGT